ncbi:hypothetical protein V8E53_015354 [Lactarius tabidus]
MMSSGWISNVGGRMVRARVRFCQGIPSLRVLASRSPLRNMSRAVPLAASRAHHTYSSRLPFSSYWNRHVHLPKAKITIREPATTRRPASFRILASPFRSSLPIPISPSPDSGVTHPLTLEKTQRRSFWLFLRSRDLQLHVGNGPHMGHLVIIEPDQMQLIHRHCYMVGVSKRTFSSATVNGRIHHAPCALRYRRTARKVKGAGIRAT